MSILIKGMEMPSCCAACKVLCDAKSETGFIRPFGERLPNCPLIELPPHGDLIDLNQLKIDVINQDYTDNANEDLIKVFRLINTAPTVIEAEKEEK